MVRERQVEPVYLEVPDPFRKPVSIVRRPEAGSTIGGVGADVAVEQHQVVLGHQFPDLCCGRASVEGEQQGRAVHGVREVAEPPVQRVPDQIGVYVDAVPRKGHGGDGHARDPGLRRDGPGQRLLPRAVQTLDHYQSAHALHPMPAVVAPAAHDREALVRAPCGAVTGLVPLPMRSSDWMAA